MLQEKQEKEILLKKFGLHLKKLREDKGLSQRELAHIINKDKSSYQRIEWGKISPSLYYLSKIAEGLEISLADLVNFEY